MQEDLRTFGVYTTNLLKDVWVTISEATPIKDNQDLC